MQSFRTFTHPVSDRLHLPPGLSKSSLCTQVFRWFCHEVAHLWRILHECYMKFISMKQAFIYVFISIIIEKIKNSGSYADF